MPFQHKMQQQEGKQPKWGRHILSSAAASSSFQSGKAPRPAAKPPPVPQADRGSGAAGADFSSGCFSEFRSAPNPNKRRCLCL